MCIADIWYHFWLNLLEWLFHVCDTLWTKEEMSKISGVLLWLAISKSWPGVVEVSCRNCSLSQLLYLVLVVVNNCHVDRALFWSHARILLSRLNRLPEAFSAVFLVYHFCRPKSFTWPEFHVNCWSASNTGRCCPCLTGLGTFLGGRFALLG